MDRELVLIMTYVDWHDRIGDVLCVRTPGFAGRMIRLGAALRDLPNLDSHIAIMHHVDAAGVPWVIEGRPGGVGWRDARVYLTDGRLMTNVYQPKTDAQRYAVAVAAESMLGTGYDWVGIAADAAHDLNLPALWRSDPHGDGPPAHVVCSSLAAWLYHHVGLPAPGTREQWDRVQPADWSEFILAAPWALPGVTHS